MPAPKAKRAEKVDITKFIAKKPKHSNMKREKNQFHFVGFYERLKTLDMKQGHSMTQFMHFDNLLDTTNEEELNNQLKSNFITLLREEKMNNRTLDFKRIFNDVEPFCFSHALLLLNKHKIVDKLLAYLQPQEIVNVSELTNDTTTKCKVLEFIIALVKDLRQESYSIFLKQIMPAVISIIDVSNLSIMDSVFTLFSFCFKYLLKPIRDDIENFYNIYSEVLVHKNRHLRHFASQCLSYVLRKLTMTEDIMKMILKPIWNTHEGPFAITHTIQGISDALYEIMYGSSEDLHSKANQILTIMLNLELDEALTKTIRFLMIKLFNSIDTPKQLPLFECIHEQLINNDPTQINLALTLFKDALLLKLGSRINHVCVIQMIESMNLIMTKKFQLISKNESILEVLAQTLSYIFYLKNQSVLQIFNQSSLDLAHSKSLFTHYIYKCPSKQVLTFFSILVKYENLNAEGEGLGHEVTYSSILSLKTKTKVEFTQESHSQKLQLLLPSLSKFIEDQIVSNKCDDVVELIAMFNVLCLHCESKTIVKQNTQLDEIIKELINNSSALTQFTIYQYAKIMNIKLNYTSKNTLTKLSVNLNESISKNYVLSRYNLQDFDILQILNFQNKGYSDNIPYHTSILANGVTENDVIQNPCDIYVLRSFNKEQSFNFEQNNKLARVLSKNLSQNSSQVRLESLKILMRFDVLQFLNPEDQEISDNYKDQDCKIFDLMYKFENCDIGFETEKIKINELTRLEVLIRSGLVPKIYLDITYDFLLGCFWIKFAPLFDLISSSITTLFKIVEDKSSYINKHVLLMQNISRLSQFEGHENDELEKIVINNSNKTRLSEIAIDGVGVCAEAYLMQTQLDEQYLETKDYFYQLSKTLGNSLSSCIFPKREFKNLLLNSFYQFIEKEYQFLHQNKINDDKNKTNIQLMIQANLMDNEVHKQYRRTAYSIFSSYLDMFKRADNLKSVPQIADFQTLLLSCLNTTDNKLQKCALQCLQKSGYKAGLMHKYQKLLEGFCDDERFKDTIPILVHGSQTRSGDADVPEEHQEDKAIDKAKRKETKSVIPKLDQEDRQSMLPVIIKLLQSKLLIKKGAINKKSLYTRRNIVYSFFSSLSPTDEFPFFFDELLAPLNLNLKVTDIGEIQTRISQVSFNTYTNFINSLEVVLKQMGSLLFQFLPLLSKILVEGVLKMTKQFIQNNKEEQIEEEMHHSAGKQAKDNFRKGLSLIKDIYRKFSHQPMFIEGFTQIVYDTIIVDQLEHLKDKYISEKSQLIEIMCLSWSDHTNNLVNFVKYPNTFSEIMAMLSHKSVSTDVCSLLMSLLKKLIVDSLDEDQRGLRRSVQQEEQQENEDMFAEEDHYERVEEDKRLRRQLSKDILKNNADVISHNIHAYWLNHVNQIKQTLSSKGKYTKTQKRNVSLTAKQTEERTEEIKRASIAKNLLLIQSELSNYLIQDNAINQDFLQMIVSVLSVKNIHNPFLHNDELLIFGAQSISCLLPKVSKESLTYEITDSILQLFMIFNHKKARLSLSKGLHESFTTGNHKGIVRVETLQLITKLNTLRRGLADMEIDYDSAIEGIKEFINQPMDDFCFLDLSAISYNIVYLIQNEEYSVREYAEHALEFVLNKLKQCGTPDQVNKLVQIIEKQIVGTFIHTVKDELALKGVIRCLKLIIIFSHDQQVETKHDLKSLYPLCNQKEENLDFFTNVLSIKLKERQRSLKLLERQILEKNYTSNLKSIEHVIMPIVDYLVFGGKTQFENRRNTISYDKDQKLNTLDNGLAVYTAYAQQLSWSEYYKLLKKLLYKLQKSGTQRRSVSAVGDPELQKEKIITKALCHVLSGFHFPEVGDAIEIMVKNKEDFEDKKGIDNSSMLWNSDFTDLLKSKVDEKDEKDEKDKIDNEDSEDEEVEEQNEEKSDNEEDVKMTGTSLTPAQVVDIQHKLFDKVLPVLEKHLLDTRDKQTVRSFVAVAFAKLIRKLPPAKFNVKLNRLVNLIVVSGLRSKDLSHREKGRKALVKLIHEISPKFLFVICDQMKAQLVKGFQQHVYLFTLHHLLQSLMQEGTLQVGCITKGTIDVNMEVLLSELFGELDQEKDNEQANERKIIKESKARKAIPIFEILAQYSDFKSSFMNLLAPIINTLESNPGFRRVQMCEDLLSRVSNSLMKNETVKGPQLLLFLYTIIQRGIKLATKIKINDEKEHRDYGATLDKSVIKRTKEEQKEISFQIDMFWKKGRETLDSNKTREISGRVLASFGLVCFRKALKSKNMVFDENKEESIERLDPFVQLILDSFKTYHNPIVVTSLTIITQIIDLGLPTFKVLLKKFLSRIFKLFQQTQSSDTEFLNSLFKCTQELIKTTVYQDLSEHQIATLIQIIKTHINKFSVQTNALNCLRSVVHRRFECADLYDLMDNVQEMMVFNTSSALRGMCSSIFIQFLIDYPLSATRIEQHINFIIKNLGCKITDGRLQLLDTLNSLFQKLPAEVLDLYCELLFFSLLIRAVNDPNTKCRTKVQHVIQSLVSNPKLNQNKVKNLLNTVFKMGSQEAGKKDMLLMAKLIAFQLLINSTKLKQQETKVIIDQLVDEVIQEQYMILNQQEIKVVEDDDSHIDTNVESFLKAIDLVEEEDIQCHDPMSQGVDDQQQWTLLFYALSCVEKLVEKQDCVSQLTKVISPNTHLLKFASKHSNYWIRNISHRILGHIFAKTTNSNRLQIIGLEIPEQQADFMYRLVDCLNQPVQTEEMRNQFVKNLIFMVNVLFEMPAEFNIEIDKVFRKISYYGRKYMLDIKTSHDKLQTILNFYDLSLQLLISKKEVGTVQKICRPILELVYRTYTDDQYPRGEPVKDLSLEIIELLQENISKPEYIETYNSVKTSILEKRLHRKTQQKQLVGTVEGIAQRQNKRDKKTQKKKLKQKEKLISKGVII